MQSPNRRTVLPSIAPRWAAHWTLAALAGFAPFLHAQTAPASAPVNPPNADASAADRLDPEALDALLGPIALYPDALVALILPASTVPTDVTLAARFLATNGNTASVDNQSWDPSVKSLTRYPDVLKWLDDNLEWTTSVGQAFVAQPADVMTSIQRLRDQAAAAGNLVDTPQQKIVKETVHEKTVIRIVPAEPEVIYVPQYDPEVVYVERQPDYIGPIIGFGVGLAVGSWLNYDCDWNRRGVYYGDYNQGWNRHGYNGGWNGGGNTVNNVNNVNVTNINNSTAQPWQPSSSSVRQLGVNRPTYAKHVQAVNANVRNNPRPAGAQKGATPRLKPPAGIPQPTRPQPIAARPNNPPVNSAKPNRPGNGPAAVAPVQPIKPGKPNVPGPNHPINKLPNQPNAPIKPNVPGKHPGNKLPSTPPSVPGELGRPNAGKPGNPHKPATPGSVAKPGNPHKPVPAPANPGANVNRPAQHPTASKPAAPKHPASSNPANTHPAPRPTKPSSPNVQKPAPRPQAPVSKPQPQRPVAKPQTERPKSAPNRPSASAPRPNKPSSSAKPSSGNNGGQNSNAKKPDKKKKDN